MGDLPDFYDLQGLTLPEELPILLHHSGAPIGYADAAALTPAGLELEGYLAPSVPAGALVALAVGGYPWEASICTRAIEREVLVDWPAWINGRALNAPACVIRRALVVEASVVARGACRGTRFTLLPGAIVPEHEAARAGFSGDPGPLPDRQRMGWNPAATLPARFEEAIELWQSFPELRERFHHHRAAFELFLQRDLFESVR